MLVAEAADRRVARVTKAVVVLATVWFGLATSWGLFARVGAGHDAVVAARSIIAENMRTWNIWGPVRQYTLLPPSPQLYYVHHPWGTFWIIAAFAKVLGRGVWVPRLTSVLMSMATPPLLYGIGRSLWGRVPGALAALAYVVLPITLAFGNFPGFEVPLTFGVLLTTWGYVRFQVRWQKRWMLVSCLGVAWATSCDWESVIFLGVVLAVLVAAFVFVPPRWFGRVDIRKFLRWWFLSALIAAATVGAYVFYFQHIGRSR